MINQMLTEHSTKTPDTRTRILEAAFNVLSRQGYENTSVKDIAEEAGVAQGLIHYHYKSKQQLVLAVLEYVCQKVEMGAVSGEAGAVQAFEQTKATVRDAPTGHTWKRSPGRFSSSATPTRARPEASPA